MTRKGKQCFQVGKEKMGVAQAAALLASPEDAERRAAWQGIQAAWTQHEESAAAILNSISVKSSGTVFSVLISLLTVERARTPLLSVRMSQQANVQRYIELVCRAGGWSLVCQCRLCVHPCLYGLYADVARTGMQGWRLELNRRRAAAAGKPVHYLDTALHQNR